MNIMNKSIVLSEYNKRASTPLNAEEVDVFVSMKSFSSDKIAEAFSLLSGRQISQEDVDLLILILDLTAALTPPMQFIRSGGGGDSIWPSIPGPNTYRKGYNDLTVAVQ